MTKKRKKSQAKRQPLPKTDALRLRKPAPRSDQIARFGVAFASLFSSLALLLGGFLVQAVYFFRAVKDGSISRIPPSLHLLWCIVDIILVVLFLKSPFFEQPKLKGIPIELINFSYVMRFQRRQFFFAAGLVTLNVIPVLYLNGTLDTLSHLALQLGSNPRMAKGLGWVGTVALSGVIGNLTTYLVVGGAKFLVGRLFRMRDRV